MDTEKNIGNGDNDGAPPISPVGTEHDFKNRKRASMNARKASFFIGDADGNKLEVKIVGPDEQEIPPDEIVVPPDGGYGYVIVFAAFLSNVIVDGIVFSFGSIKDFILNDPSIKENGGEELDQSTVAWVGSLLTGFYLLAGPFVSAIASRYGFRTVAILGSLLASGAFATCWFLNRDGPNIGYLIVFYGIIGGTGFSCIYVPAVIAVGFYFEKKRALATGIAICGSGIGNFLFPPFISKLAKNLGWQMAVLILGLIVLGCALLGILYRPLKAKKGRRTSRIGSGETPEGTPLLMRIKRARDMMKWDSVNSFISNRGESLVDIQRGNSEEHGQRRGSRKYSTASLKGTAPVPIPTVAGMQKKRASVPSMLTNTGESPSFPQAAGLLVNIPSKATSLKAKSFVGLPDLHEIEEEHGSDDAGSRENSVGPHRAHLTESALNEYNKSAEAGTDNSNMMGRRKSSIMTSRIGNSMLTVDEMTNSRIIRVASRVTLNKPLYRDDIFYSGSLLRIPDYANNVMTSTEWTAAVTRAPEDEEEDEMPTTPAKCCGSCDVMKKMLDFSLLLSPTFIVFCVSGMFSMMGMFVPFVYLMDQAFVELVKEDPELKKESLTTLLSLIGAANTVGRILSGWIADRPFVNALILNNAAVTLMGISNLLVPMLSSYPQFILFSCVFGISMACFASLRSILVVELLGLAKLTNAFGLLLLFQGIASMVATPLAGIIAQLTGSFSMAFYTAGGFLILSAVMCYPLNKLNNWEKSRKKAKSIDVPDPAQA